MTEHTIKEIIVVWEEHANRASGKPFWEIFQEEIKKRLSANAAVNFYFYRPSQMGSAPGVKQFLHEGTFTNHDQNRELAVLKFCTCGFIDENETYFHLLKQWRNQQPTVRATAERCICVVFICTNANDGMKRAIEWWERKRDSGIKLSNKHLFCLVKSKPATSEERVIEIAAVISSYLTQSEGIHIKTRPAH